MVAGSGASKSEEFTFTVELTEKLDGDFGQMKFAGGVATFRLKHGQKVEAVGLPAGVGYEVSESDNEGYTVSSTGATGRIVADSTAVASFENYKDGSDNVSVTVKKLWVLDDGSKPANSVTIELLCDGKRYDTVLLDASCGWTRTWSGLSSKFKWTVAEVDVPEGFKSTVSREGDVWTIVNDDIPGSSTTDPIPDPTPGSKPGQGPGPSSDGGSSALPSTGDNSGTFVAGVAAAGVLLFAAGVFRLRMRRNGNDGQ